MRNKYLFFDSQVCSSLYFQIAHFKWVVHIPHSALPALGTRALILHLQCITKSLIPHSQWMFVAVILSIDSKVVSDYFVTPSTVVHQAPLSMGFSRQEYWSGLHFLLQFISKKEIPKSHLRTRWKKMRLISFQMWILPSLCTSAGFPGGSEVKVSACNVGDLGSIPGSMWLQAKLQGGNKALPISRKLD